MKVRQNAAILVCDRGLTGHGPRAGCDVISRTRENAANVVRKNASQIGCRGDVATQETYKRVLGFIPYVLSR